MDTGRDETSSTSCSWSHQLSWLRALVAALRSPPTPRSPIMASALIVLFLGCWLAGQSGLSG
ncbi:hypothetical protein G0U57_013072 [Chelydra serpentina]|uniref:Uncharacterized protein n=1 Tax=Chelydra serpentina TaxID=8475 RepID=A0A8T1SB55_CHESE|nr:hypothetical protein G0U57_013072 [Chelydra serpentina]